MERPHKSLFSRFGIWMFDLDDTLMWNCTTYNQPIIDLVNYLTLVFGNRIPSMGTIVRVQEDIDCGMSKEINPRTGSAYGFGADRFPDSFIRTYRALCEKGFGVYDESVAQHCRTIGTQAFAVKNYAKLGLVPGAWKILTFLAKRQHLVLVTKGEQWVQQNKINALGLSRWFEDIYIVDHKDGETYLEILADLRAKAGDRRHIYAPMNVVAIGNSFSSDIAPALKLGMEAIFIPCPTWKAESVDVGTLTEEERQHFLELKQISEIRALFG